MSDRVQTRRRRESVATWTLAVFSGCALSAVTVLAGDPSPQAGAPQSADSAPTANVDGLQRLNDEVKRLASEFDASVAKLNRLSAEVARLRQERDALAAMLCQGAGAPRGLMTASGVIGCGSAPRPGANIAEPGSANVYVVRAGDTLSSISRRHGVSVHELAALNRITEVNLLRPGQRLRIRPTDGHPARVNGRAAGTFLSLAPVSASNPSALQVRLAPEVQTADSSNANAGAGAQRNSAASPLIIAQAETEITPQPPIPLEPAPAPRQPATVEPRAPTVPAPEAEIEPDRPSAEKPLEQLLLQEGGILLPKGILQIEPSIDYSHISTDGVAISGLSIFDAIIIGTIRVDELERDIITGTLTGRYGLTDRIQLEARVPGVWREDTELLGVGTSDQRERTIDGFDLGDIEAGISWQALSARGFIPDTIVRLRARFPTGENPFEIPRETVGRGGETRLTEAPTGNGFYGVGGGATFVWRSDPAVFFAGGNYTANLSRTFDDFGEIEPGDSFEWFAGFNVALSERVSLNLSFVNDIITATEQNGQETLGSSVNDGRLVLGSSVGLGRRTTLVTSAAVGVTEESPDFTFTVSLPINFDLF